MKRSPFLLKSLLLTALGLCAGSPAARAAETLSVLGIEAEDPANERLATTLTTALRKEIGATEGYKVVPGRDLVEVKLIFSCPDESPSCMVQAAASLNASQIVFGTIGGGATGETIVTLKLLDARKGRIVSFLSEPIAANQKSAAALQSPVKKWFASLTGRIILGSIRIRSTSVGATIAVDGVPSGVTTDGAVEVDSVTPGDHTVAVTKRGFAPFETGVTVEAGKAVDVHAKLVDEAGAVVPPTATSATEFDLGEKPTEHSATTIGAWSAAGIGVVSMALAIKFGLDVLQFNKDLDPYRQFPCDSDSGKCDINGNEIEVDPSLSKSEVAAMERQRSKEVQSLKDDGAQATTLQYVFWGVTGAMAVTSGVLFYLAADKNDGDDSDSASSGHNLTIAPTIQPGGAGFVGRFTF
ncbi:MAG: PEGA domain-containing protein [Deltaproteobacteria bacterium]|nr:PEGA domain-containing protein [Deltaproteobacteria bacterium]